MKTWLPDLSRSNGPRYMAIADVIEMDLKSGKLLVGVIQMFSGGILAW